jgi:uncharacterized protein YndB with AHSA1/START domain
VDMTTISVTVECPVDAPVAEVFEILADPTAMARWSPECVRISWVDGWRHAEPGARFQGHNKMGDLEWDVICQITEVRPSERIAWVVLGPANDPSTPSSTWTHTLSERPGGTLVTTTFQHGDGGSHLVTAMAAKPERAAAIMEFRRKRLQHNMSAALVAMAEELTRQGTGR